MIIIFVEKEKCRSGSGMTVLLFMGMVIPGIVMSYKFVFNSSASKMLLTLTVFLSPAEISPEFVVLSNELIKMLGVKDKDCF